MDKALQDQITNMLSSIADNVGSAKDFAVSQAPDLVQSYVLYGRISLTVTCLTSLVLFILAVFTIRYALKRFLLEDRGERWIVLITVSFFIGLTSFLAFSTNVSECFLVWVAPKVWLLKQLVSFAH